MLTIFELVVLPTLCASLKESMLVWWPLENNKKKNTLIFFKNKFISFCRYTFPLRKSTRSTNASNQYQNNYLSHESQKTNGKWQDVEKSLHAPPSCSSQISAKEKKGGRGKERGLSYNNNIFVPISKKPLKTVAHLHNCSCCSRTTFSFAYRDEQTNNDTWTSFDETYKKFGTGVALRLFSYISIPPLSNKKKNPSFSGRLVGSAKRFANGAAKAKWTVEESLQINGTT